MSESAPVDLLSLDELDAASAEVEAAIDATPGIDPWCSGPDWTLPVHLGFAPGAERILARVGGTARPGFALLARYATEDGRRIVGGLDPLWGFATPLVGPDIEMVAASLADLLEEDGAWDLLWLAGMPAPAGPRAFLPRLVNELGWLGRVGLAPGISTRLADLGGGYEPWLARRSSRFRRNLRQAERRAATAGLTIHDASDDPEPFGRILAIELRSWKGQRDDGITTPAMAITYRAMVNRLARTDRLRLHVARLGGEDVGYILGGVRGRTYRGLQLSYTTEVAPLSVGHLLQHHQIQLLAASGDATVYDLGMDMPYKERWADITRTSHTLVIDRGSDVLA
jgi:CelD/BcsL family acetyltransferase involved in cellulose biosynthesis